MMDECENRWMNEWMDGWGDGWMNEQIDRQQVVTGDDR